jgi:hypothetical protein
MNLDELTIGEAKKLAAMFPVVQFIETDTNPPPERAVIVTTDKRGVFFGYATRTDGETIKLRAARNAYYWSANAGGVLALASEGPRDGSKIGVRADIELRGITAVISCTDAAVKVWEDAKWKP